MDRRGCVTLKPICIITSPCFWLQQVLACIQQACSQERASATPTSEVPSFRLMSVSSLDSVAASGGAAQRFE